MAQNPLITLQAISACGTYNETIKVKPDELAAYTDALEADGWKVTQIPNTQESQ